MNPRLRFFGVAAYELIHANGRRILVDPFLDHCPGNPVKSDQLEIDGIGVWENPVLAVD